MASENNKKLSIIYILKILQEYTDKDHLLTQTDISKKIYNIYGMNCERKSISANIKSLQDIGFNIIEVKRKGVYFENDILNSSEINFIIDAIFSSKSVNGNQAKTLSEKLYNLSSIYQRKRFNYIYKAEEINRTNSKQVFYNIDVINEAISNNKQIEFGYKYYDIKGELIERDNKKYLVNPYFLLNSQGRYYLICNYDYYDNLSYYKIEHITKIKIVDSEIKPITKIKGYEKGIDITKFANEHFYMLNGKTITAQIKLKSYFDIHYVFDWFGNNAKITKLNNEYVANVTANDMAIKYWCLQYGNCVELVSPKQTRDEIKKIVNEMFSNYKS